MKKSQMRSSSWSIPQDKQNIYYKNMSLFKSISDFIKKNNVMSEEASHPSDHPLTYKQKQLVQGTWEKVTPIAETAAEIFYTKLFELDPEVKPLFKESDMKEQGKKLMQMIGAEHYGTVASALLFTLDKGLGEDFTEETKEAWTITYTTLADLMIAAGKEA